MISGRKFKTQIVVVSISRDPSENFTTRTTTIHDSPTFLKRFFSSEEKDPRARAAFFQTRNGNSLAIVPTIQIDVYDVYDIEPWGDRGRARPRNRDISAMATALTKSCHLRDKCADARKNKANARII